MTNCKLRALQSLASTDPGALIAQDLSLALAGALILALGTAGVAQAVNSHQSVAVKLAHSKAGTAAKPKSVGALTVDMKVALDPSDPSFATRSAVIHFDKSLVFNSAKFPSCTEAQVLSGAAACAKAKIGSGKAVGPRARPAAGPGRHGLQRSRAARRCSCTSRAASR